MYGDFDHLCTLRKREKMENETITVITAANLSDKEQVLALYEEQKGRDYCYWDEDYPSEESFDFDIDRQALFVMKQGDRIVAAISIDEDENIEKLECWDKDLLPGGELARLAVSVELQNTGIAKEMLRYGMEELKARGCKSVHFLVNRGNKKAVGCYSHFDFNIVGDCDLYEEDFLCYEKAL